MRLKLYTLQNIKAWEEAKAKGYLTGNEEHVDKEWFGRAYAWMMEQMAKRIKGYNNEYPVWFWLDVDNICVSELLDDNWVLLEVELADDKILVSNFNAWHCVLNEGYLIYEGIDNKEESWELIFDRKMMGEYCYDWSDDSLQVTVGKIDCKDIKVLKYIVNESKAIL